MYKLIMFALGLWLIVLPALVSAKHSQNNYCVVPVVDQPAYSSSGYDGFFRVYPIEPYVIASGRYGGVWTVRDFNKAKIISDDHWLSFMNASVFSKEKQNIWIYSPHKGGVQHNSRVFSIDSNIISQLTRTDVIEFDSNLRNGKYIEPIALPEESIELEPGVALKVSYRAIELYSEGKETPLLGSELIRFSPGKANKIEALSLILIRASNGLFVVGVGKNKGRGCAEINKPIPMYQGVKKLDLPSSPSFYDRVQIKKGALIVHSFIHEFYLLSDNAQKISDPSKILAPISVSQILGKKLYLNPFKVIGGWLIIFEDGEAKFTISMEEINKVNKVKMLSQFYSQNLNDFNDLSVDEKSKLLDAVIKNPYWGREREDVLRLDDSVILNNVDHLKVIERKGVTQIDRRGAASDAGECYILEEPTKNFFAFSNEGEWHLLRRANEIIQLKKVKNMKQFETACATAFALLLVNSKNKEVRSFDKVGALFSEGFIRANSLSKVGISDAGIPILKSIGDKLVLFWSEGVFLVQQNAFVLHYLNRNRMGVARNIYTTMSGKHFLKTNYGLFNIDEALNSTRVSFEKDMFHWGAFYEDAVGLLVGNKTKYYIID